MLSDVFVRCFGLQNKPRLNLKERYITDPLSCKSNLPYGVQEMNKFEDLHFWQANFYRDASVWLYLLMKNVYTA